MEPRNSLKSATLAISFLLVSSTFVGCAGRYTGGGFLDSAAAGPTPKASFGFVIDAIEPDAFGLATKVKGQFQYADQAKGVRFHVDRMTPAGYGVVLGGPFDPQAILFAYTGTYNCAAGTGTVDVGVGSHGMVGPNGEVNGDAVMVRVLSGPYAGYSNSGLVKGGTIQFQPQ